MEKIHHLKHHEIDKSRWDEVIEKSIQGRIYATSLWLDCVSPNWDALIYGDWEILMPLPVKRKFGIRYLAQPPLTQQLGFYSLSEIDIKILEVFYQKMISLFSYGNINVYHNFHPEGYAVTKRKNYILSLKRQYIQINNGYSRSVRANIRKSKKINLSLKTSSEIDVSVQKIKAIHISRIKSEGKIYDFLKILFNQFSKTGQSFVLEAFDCNDEFLGNAVYFKDTKRIYEIAAAFNKKGRDLEAHPFLIDHVLEKHADTNYIFDFEGSNILGIEKFNQSFGALLEPYYAVSWNNLPLPLRLFKK